jgi:hypothetical protein
VQRRSEERRLSQNCNNDPRAHVTLLAEYRLLDTFQRAPTVDPIGNTEERTRTQAVMVGIKVGM